VLFGTPFVREDLRVGPRRAQNCRSALGNNLGTTWEQLRPNTRENGGAGPTSKQDESTRWTSRPCLQNLHPRFKSGRRLQIPGSNSIVCVLAHKRASSIGLTVDYKSAGCCASLYAKQLIQNDLIVRALDKGGGFQDLHLEKRRSRRRSLFAQMLRHHVRSSKAHSRLTVKTGALRVAAVSARSSGGDITDRRPW
jgi:hypothetical protein